MSISEQGIESMREPVGPEPSLVPAHEWISPEHRAAAEKYFLCELGSSVYVLASWQRNYLATSGPVIDRALKNVNREIDPRWARFEKRFRLLYGEWLDDQGGVSGDGYILVGADTRQVAEHYQRKFVACLNEELEARKAPFRLWTPS